ncbi:MAG: protein adenylyltransferase SelO [Gemmatimonadota bacterium]
MPPLTGLHFDNSYARLHPVFYEVVDPTPLTDPYLIAWNPDAAALLDLDPDSHRGPDAARYLSGALRLPGAEPVAAIYAGHQFGVWVPQLGDGRAILLGEVVNGRGERWDLQLKGAGPTRFSRMGDGRSVLRSAVREYLCSEAMDGLGIPTTRALAITGSDDVVYREVPETAATLIRLAPSHVRFGTFELFASRGQVARVRDLADYVIALHYPALGVEADRYRRLLEEVVGRTARLIAQWMAVGFAHGVMNTDNMSVLGLTLDYGPFGFLDRYDPGFICNHTDQDGRYMFDRQPAVGRWNLARFAEALLDLITEDEANEALGNYPVILSEAYSRAMRAKLGLTTAHAGDSELIRRLLDLLAATQADYTQTFRALGAVSTESGEPPEALRALVVGGALDQWVGEYIARLRAENSVDVERAAAMARANPKYVLRNYLAQVAIERAQEKDPSEIERLRFLLRNPFEEHPGMERYAEPPPPWARDLMVSCSS